jgi:hypothetical protein
MNGYEMAAREAKTSRLIDTLVEASVTAAVAATLDDGDWAAVSRLAKCNQPSETTRALVVKRLEQIEAAASRKRSA